MAVCRETGEVVAELLLTVTCNPLRDPETGEKTKEIRSIFKIPSTITHQTSAKKHPEKHKCCGGAYVITLAFVTLMMFAPAYGVTLWLGLEVLYHIYTHRRPGMYQHPLHVFFFEEFCAYCQSKVRMNKVQQLQDRRYRHYVSNIPNIPVGS